MTIYLLCRPKIANTRNIEFAVLAPNEASCWKVLLLPSQVPTNKQLTASEQALEMWYIMTKKFYLKKGLFTL